MALTRRHLLAAALVLAAPVPLRARAAQVVPVADRGALDRALRAAGPGQVLALAPGDYGALTAAALTGAAGAPLVIAAADPARPPRLSGLILRDAAHVALTGLHLAWRFGPGDAIDIRPFAVTGSTGIAVRGCRIEGDLARGVSPVEDGHGWGIGLTLTDVAGLRVEGCALRRWHRGIELRRCADAVVADNDLAALRMDGMTFAQVAGARIERNTIRDFDRVPEVASDHADMIQFWTTGTAAPSRDIVIRDNLLSSGRGLFTQSIFLRNERVDQGLAGPEMHYRNVLIERNVILNAHLHGITVGETDGLVIRRNSICRNALSSGAGHDATLWTPRINVAAAARQVAILHNVTGGLPAAQPGWQVARNLVVQDRTRLAPNHPAALFAGDPADPAGFRYRPGGPLDGAGLGAPQMQG